jgi:hypothetical protein
VITNEEWVSHYAPRLEFIGYMSNENNRQPGKVQTAYRFAGGKTLNMGNVTLSVGDINKMTKSTSSPQPCWQMYFH